MELRETSAAALEADRFGKVQELGHIVLYVSDVKRSVEFYGGLLGWKQISTPPGAPVALFSGGRTHHELLLIEVGTDAAPIPPGRRVGMYHFALKVGSSDEELLAALDRVIAAPHLARFVGASDHHVSHSLYVLDPDGNEVELFVDVPGVDWQANPELILAPIRPLVINGRTI